MDKPHWQAVRTVCGGRLGGWHYLAVAVPRHARLVP
jgi:hypothetical protein